MTIKQADIDRITSNLLRLSKSNKFNFPVGICDDLAEAVDLIDALAAKVTSLDEDGVEPTDRWGDDDADECNNLFRTTDVS